MKTAIIFVVTNLLLLGNPVAALTVYVCVDAGGEESFYSDQCPPGTHKAKEQEVKVWRNRRSQDPAAIAEEHPVTLYVSKDCDACDLVRLHLQKRGVPFTEKDAGSDMEVQNELLEVSGSMKIPALTVGEQVVSGYNRNEIDDALTAAGYPPAQKPETQ